MDRAKHCHELIGTVLKDRPVVGRVFFGGLERRIEGSVPSWEEGEVEIRLDSREGGWVDLALCSISEINDSA